MSNIIEARVRQKTDTLANWNANDLVLLGGEPAFVISQDGQPVNFKLGDGTKTFSELPFWIQYDQAAFIPMSGLALPTPTQTVGYSILGEGTYTHSGGGFTVPTGHWGVANWDGSAWSFSDMGELPTTPVADEVVEGGTEATSQDAVFRNNMIVYVGNAANPANIEVGLILSSGAFAPTAGNKRIKNIPAFNGVPMTITGVRPSASKRISLYSEKDGVGWISNAGSVNLATITITPSGLPVNGGYLAFMIKVSAEADDATAFPALQVEYGTVASEYKAYDGVKKVIKASQTEIEAAYLKPGTTLNNSPIATEDFVSDNAITNSDLEVTESVNLADPSKRVVGAYIDSAGNIISSDTSWSYLDVDTSEYPVGQEITISNAVISTGHAAWYNGATKVAYAGSYATGSLPVTFVKPANGNRLLVTDMRSGVENPNIMINLGNTALPYEPWHDPKLSKIKGYSIESSGGGGEAYDQSLNTTDSVSFAKVTAAAMSFPLPEGAGVPPVGVLVGDAWIDTTDDTIKVRRS